MKYDEDQMKKTFGVREQAAGFSGKAKMKRLTIDVPANLHSAVKVECARKGVKMADTIRDILENEFLKVE